ncbi:MAG TPA: hypothetical protein PKH33_16570 [bacterium]|nr:hypothetical protein [bacterium]
MNAIKTILLVVAMIILSISLNYITTFVVLATHYFVSMVFSINPYHIAFMFRVVHINAVIIGYLVHKYSFVKPFLTLLIYFGFATMLGMFKYINHSLPNQDVRLKDFYMFILYQLCDFVTLLFGYYLCSHVIRMKHKHISTETE